MKIVLIWDKWQYKYVSRRLDPWTPPQPQQTNSSSHNNNSSVPLCRDNTAQAGWRQGAGRFDKTLDWRHLDISAKLFRRARLSWASPWAFRLGLWMMQDHWSGDGQFIDALNLQNKRFTVSFRVCKARWSGVVVVVSSLISLCVLLTPPLPRAASWDLVTTMQLLAAGFIHCYYGFNRGAG